MRPVSPTVPRYSAGADGGTDHHGRIDHSPCADARRGARPSVCPEQQLTGVPLTVRRVVDRGSWQLSGRCAPPARAIDVDTASTIVGSAGGDQTVRRPPASGQSVSMPGLTASTSWCGGCCHSHGYARRDVGDGPSRRSHGRRGGGGAVRGLLRRLIDRALAGRRRNRRARSVLDRTSSTDDRLVR